MNKYYQVFPVKKGEWNVREIEAKDRSAAMSITEIEMFITKKYEPYSFIKIFDTFPEFGMDTRFGESDKFNKIKIELPNTDDKNQYMLKIKNRNLKN